MTQPKNTFQDYVQEYSKSLRQKKVPTFLNVEQSAISLEQIIEISRKTHQDIITNFLTLPEEEKIDKFKQGVYEAVEKLKIPTNNIAQQTVNIPYEIFPSEPNTNNQFKIIGDYVVTEKLGEGGMGKVYKAYNEQTKRSVAIKVLTKDPDEKRLQRIQNEIESMAKLDHPGIVKILHVVDKTKIVMEFVEGITFTDYIEKLHKKNTTTNRNRVTEISHEKFKIQQLHIFLKILDAIKYAHENGIVHRDLKPDNIMITKKREVKIMDFGLAKSSEESVELSQTHEILGTPLYISPEQVKQDSKSKKGKPSMDIYALGTILYQIITGKLPHTGDKIIQVIASKLTTIPPSPHERDTTIPKNLSKICMRALEIHPENRYQTVNELQEDLESYLHNNTLVHAEKTQVSTVNKILKNSKLQTILFALGMSIASSIVMYFITNATWENTYNNAKENIKNLQKENRKSRKKYENEIAKKENTILKNQEKIIALKNTIQNIQNTKNGPQNMIEVKNGKAIIKSGEFISFNRHKEMLIELHVILREQKKFNSDYFSEQWDTIIQSWNIEQYLSEIQNKRIFKRRYAVHHAEVLKSLVKNIRIPQDTKHWKAWIAYANFWYKTRQYKEAIGPLQQALEVLKNTSNAMKNTPQNFKFEDIAFANQSILSITKKIRNAQQKSQNN